jgi:hypothetical protein
MEKEDKRIIEWAISFIDKYILDPYATDVVLADTHSVALEVRDELSYLIADEVIINGRKLH